MASSSLVQIIALWRPFVWCLVALCLLGLLVLGMICTQYYGLFRGLPWAREFDIQQLNQGLLTFALVLLFTVIGGVPTWYAFFN